MKQCELCKQYGNFAFVRFRAIELHAGCWMDYTRWYFGKLYGDKTAWYPPETSNEKTEKPSLT